MNSISEDTLWWFSWIRSLRILLVLVAPGALGAQGASDAVRAETAAEAQEAAWLSKQSEWAEDGHIPPDTKGRFKAEPIGVLGRLRLFRVTTRTPDGQWPPFLVAFQGGELLRLGGFPSPDLIAAWRAILATGKSSLADVSDSLLLATSRSLAWVAIPELSAGVPTGVRALAEVTPYRPTVGGGTCRPGGPTRDQPDSVIRRYGSTIVRVTLPVRVNGITASSMITWTWWFVLNGQGELSGWETYTAPLCQSAPP